MNIMKPGTEDVILSTPVMDLVIFTDVHKPENAKARFAIVHKRRTPVYADQFTDPNGHPVSIITRHLFEDIQVVLKDTMHRIQGLERDLDKVTTQRDSYKMTIDTLKKNGVID